MGVATEMIEALEGPGVQMVTKLLNKICDTQKIPEDMSKSMSIALPKKFGAVESEQCCTTDQMSQVMKILLQIIMMRMRNKIHHEVEQCGFVEDKGTVNALHIQKTLRGRAIKEQDLYLCFINYTRTFSMISYIHLITLLNKPMVDARDLRIIKNICWQQTAAICRYENLERMGRLEEVFSLYKEFVLRALEEIPSILIESNNVNNLCYADDTALIATSE